MKSETLIYDLDLEDLQERLLAWGQPAYRAHQVWEGLYRQLWDKPHAFSNLPLSLRQQLEKHFCFRPLEPAQQLESQDGSTLKTLFRLASGEAIEAVLMRYPRRNTLCISTQVGCAMGCVFCATGQMGLRANLSSGEIVAQVLYYARLLKATGERPTNVVLMGMGEPFHNYEASLQAIDRLNHPDGFKFGARRFTISTVGLVPAILRFARERRQVNLAISLHAADDQLRSSLLPVNRKYPLTDLLEACHEYVRLTGRRVTFEWALIRDTNDSLDQARKLATLLKGLLCHVNVIPLNPIRAYPGRASPMERARAFRGELLRHNIPCTIRQRRGIDIQAGCGQLAIHQTPASR